MNNDKSILQIASDFWNEDRRNAFNICYKSIRIIDDLVDNRKADTREITENEKQQLITKIKNWVDAIKTSTPKDKHQQQLIETIKLFNIPIKPFEKFSKAMIYDLNYDGFKTFQDFLNYSEGAAIAPSSIGVYLCGLTKKNGKYIPPKYDILAVTRPAAIFAYIVHIIRDFQKDHANNLNYFADDIMKENGLNLQMLKKMASDNKITPEFRNMIKTYYNYAKKYQQTAKKMKDLDFKIK